MWVVTGGVSPNALRFTFYVLRFTFYESTPEDPMIETRKPAPSPIVKERPEPPQPGPLRGPLTSTLRRMARRPFGIDENGRPITHGSGKLIVGAIESLQLEVGERAAREAPEGTGPREREALIKAARSA